MTGFIEKYFMPLAAKVAANRYLAALRDGFVYTIPFTVVGSIFLLIACFPVQAWTDALAAAGLLDYFWIVTGATFDILAVFVVIGISYHLAKHYKLDALAVALLSFIAFLMLIPTSVTSVDQATGVATTVGGVIPKEWLGSKAIFLAIFVAFGVTEVFNFVVKRNWTIKMPAGVPPTVSASFSALIPAAIIITIVWIIAIAIDVASGGDHIANIIFTWLQQPLQNIGDTFFGMVANIFAANFLWMLGLHGSAIVGGVTSPVFTANSMDNLALYQAGQLSLENGAHIVTQTMFDCYINTGGSGMTLGVVILMVFGATKAKRYKTLGKIALPGGVFTINEPILFGLPIVLNPVMFIPFILAPIVAGTITYVAIAVGFMPPLNGIPVPWTTPVIISGLVTAGWQGALIQIVNLVVVTLIYLPFLMVLDKQAVQEELEAETTE